MSWKSGMILIILVIISGLIILFFTEKEGKQVSTTYWEAVDLSPIHTGTTPPTKWKIEIRNAENIVVLDSKLQEKIGELLAKNPDYSIGQIRITAEVEVVIKKE